MSIKVWTRMYNVLVTILLNQEVLLLDAPQCLAQDQSSGLLRFLAQAGSRLDLGVTLGGCVRLTMQNALQSSFPSELDLLEDDLLTQQCAADGSSLLASFPSEECLADSEGTCGLQEALVAAPTEDTAAASSAQPAMGRGRKPGTVALRRMLEEVAHEHQEAANNTSLSEKRRAASNARWSKRSRDAICNDAGPGESSVVATAAGSVEDILSASVHTVDPKSAQAIQAGLDKYKADGPHTDYKTELDLFNSLANITFKRVAAEAADTSVRTLTRKTRLLAAILVIARRHRNLMCVRRVHEYLQSIAGNLPFRALAFLILEKFDGVSFLLSVPESAAKTTDEGKTPAEKETTIAKLLQLSIAHHCAWRLGDRRIALRFKQPTIMQSVESNSAECYKSALLRQMGDVSWAQSMFELAGRITMTDEAGPILKANASIAQDLPWMKLLQVICKFHKKQKTAKMQLDVFDTDRSGAVNITLALQYGGSFRKLKRCMKGLIKQRLVCIPWGTDGPGREVIEQNEQFLALFCGAGEDDSLSGPGTANQLAYIIARRTLWNGMRGQRRIEHFENGCCPPGPKQTLRRIDKEIINKIRRPRGWNTDKWIGAKRPLQFVGEWLHSNFLLEDSWELAFGTGFKAEKPASAAGSATDSGTHTAGSAEDRDGDVGLFAVGDVDAEEMWNAACADAAGSVAQVAIFDDIGAQDTSFVRSKTYRLNGLRWLKTRPHGRFYAMTAVSAVQQHDAASFAKQVGSKWDRREMINRQKGKAPNYRCVDTACGKYTTAALTRYGDLLREESPWLGLQPEERTHSLSNQVYRSCAVSTATTYQLEVLRERDNNFAPTLTLKGTPTERFLKATKLVEEYRDYPCKVPDFWVAFLNLYPTAEDILGGRPECSVLLSITASEDQGLDQEPLRRNGSWSKP